MFDWLFVLLTFIIVLFYGLFVRFDDEVFAAVSDKVWFEETHSPYLKKKLDKH